jgi:hypothetical protein
MRRGEPARQRAALGLPVVLAVTLALVLAGCTGGGRFERDDAQINAAPASEPGVNELMIPELLEPTMSDGVSQFQYRRDR